MEDLMLSFDGDSAGVEIVDDFAEEAEKMAHGDPSHSLLAKVKTVATASESMGTGDIPQQSEEVLGNILEAASKAVQEKTDLAYKGYDNPPRY